MTKHNDYLIAGIAGFVTALFLMPVLFNLEYLNTAYAVGALILIPVLWMAGILLGKILAKWMAFFAQFSKFVVVGFLNASIDFGILNAMNIFTGAVSGFIIGSFNAPGFIIASFNSYFWNRLWVFPQTNGVRKMANFQKFLIISLLGVFLNSLVIIYLTTYAPQFGFSDKVWLNIAKAIASAAVLLWNFVGYKFFAFK
ncbi:MAG: Glycosyl transferase family 2 [Candidatus Giovannonibacteria bacterium GW2011_GWA2_44_13b]|uniref:Glycosyl transferase family 2 n=2 Tax=Candidatus Giovannoniibacteriota TaxID=1752738 RepID=A0A0G1H726_9BACT|nr:MAG: Glycosyl transferase family 2 [Candidatus Giovannonibacteria bacterium GW2011_GWA2_44_13b]OGF83218.1 MAG: hypothetical protein A2924_02790 [Candidatus Giovannonibacteria bacterium RIFCSPLOWO2_01_FULL_44_16]